MTDSSGAPSRPPATVPTGLDRNLALRAVSGVVMAALALAADAVGGVTFVAFWTAAALVIYWEWSAIVARHARLLLGAGLVALAVAGALAAAGRFGVAVAVLAGGAAAATLVAPQGHRRWGAGGVLYAGSVVLAPAVIRHDGRCGALAILFLFAVVWSTDIFGYFVGRLFGGPKLALRLSPNKTWTGALGGTIGAIAAGGVVMYSAGNTALLSTACIALVLSIVSQGGDLFESSVKRRFGVKDASHVIPGHGGLMDRLDGFLAAASVAALIGLARGGTEASARGLLMW